MTLTFSELDGDIRVPTIAVETDLDKGRTGLPSSDQKVLCLGYPLAAGSYTANKLYQTRDVDTAKNLFGAGSQLARMVELVLKVDANLDVWCFPYDEAGAGTQATEDIVIATAATGNGTLTARIGGITFRAGIQNGDSVTTIGDELEAQINAHPNAPFTASNAAGTVAVTARNKGAAGNTIGIAAEITAGIGTTVTVAADFLSTGATDSDPTTPLVEIQGHRFHLIAVANNDAVTMAAVKTHIELLSQALKQKWGMAVAGHNGTGTAANTLAGTTCDSYRCQVAWLENCANPCFDIAATFSALRASETRRNMPLNDLKLAGLVVPEDKTDWPLDTTLDTALKNGVTPLRPELNGNVKVVRSIHTRVTSPSFIDHNPMGISDFIDEDLISQARARYGRAPLKSLSAPGTSDTLTPDRFKALLKERMMIWDSIDYVQGTRHIWEQTDLGKELGTAHAEVNASDPNRLDVGYPFVPTWGAHVIAIKKTLTLPPIGV